MRWLAVLVLGGCSAALVSGPPRCTKTYVAPVIDTVIASAALGLFVAVATPSRGDGGDGEVARTAIGGPAVILMLAHGISAIHGYSTVSACRVR